MTLESAVERAAVDFANLMGVESLKLTLQGNRGWPDRLFMKDGHFLFIEFKRPGEVTRPLQNYRIKWLVDNGFNVAVCDTIEQSKVLILSWLESLPHGRNSRKSRSRPMT